MRVAITYLAILSSAILIGVALASIEKEPVKVTHKNSGPKYDFDDVERTRLTPQADNPAENLIFPPRAQNPFVTPEAANGDSAQSEPQSSGDVAPTPIGHISIRRIFLVPMTAPQTDGGMWSSSQSGAHSLGASSDRSGPSDEESSGAQEQPRLFGAGPSRPFWPFMGPPRPHHHHLLGGDEASRSPTPDSSMERPLQVERPEGEREEPEQGVRMMIDPIQMMMEMLQHALNPQLAPTSGTSLFKDLNKEASGSPSGSDDNGDRRPSGDSGLEKPQQMPSMKNETKEDVVEIDGKKYLRKTVINRHVGENIIFMTKRLIFVPLNETTTNEEPSSATTTTTIAPPSINVASTEVPVPSSTSNPQEATTTTTTTAGAGEPKVEAAITSTNPPTTEAPTTVAAGNSDTSTTTTPSTTTSGGDNAAEETTARGETIMEKVSDAISRAVERLEERAGSSTTTTSASSSAISP